MIMFDIDRAHLIANPFNSLCFFSAFSSLFLKFFAP
jgi:hypothetical protein